jgi:crotonobetainyl-CoA:carnitine CoA-transferase CaiB-like acyl-CoA transferase
MFSSLHEERFASNEGRRKGKKVLHAAVANITCNYKSSEVSRVLTESAIPHSPITPIEKVADLPFVASSALRTTTPDGCSIRLPPPAVPTNYLEQQNRELPFAPAYGEHTDSLLAEIGLPKDEIISLRDRGIVA